MAYEYRCIQHNYQFSGNADNYSTDSQLNALDAEGWEIVNSDVGSFPYVTILWRRQTGKGQSS